MQQMLQELGRDLDSQQSANVYIQTSVSEKCRTEDNNMEPRLIDKRDFEFQHNEMTRSMPVGYGSQNEFPYTQPIVLNQSGPYNRSFENYLSSNQNEQQEQMTAPNRINSLNIDQSQIISPLEQSLVSSKGDDLDSDSTSFRNHHYHELNSISSQYILSQNYIESFQITESEHIAHPNLLPQAEDRSESITDLLQDPNNYRQNHQITPLSSIETNPDTYEQPQINQTRSNEHQKYEEQKMYYSEKQTEITQAQDKILYSQSDYDQPKSFPPDDSLGSYSGQVPSLPNAQEIAEENQQDGDKTDRQPPQLQNSMTFGLNSKIIQQEPNFQMQMSDNALQNGWQLSCRSNQSTNSMTPKLESQINYGENQFMVQSGNYSHEASSNYSHQEAYNQSQEYNKEVLSIEFDDDSSQDASSEEEMIVICEDEKLKQRGDEIHSLQLYEGITNIPADRQIQTLPNYNRSLQPSNVQQGQGQGNLRQPNSIPDFQGQPFAFPRQFTKIDHEQNPDAQDYQNKRGQEYQPAKQQVPEQRPPTIKPSSWELSIREGADIYNISQIAINILQSDTELDIKGETLAFNTALQVVGEVSKKMMTVYQKISHMSRNSDIGQQEQHFVIRLSKSPLS